MALKNGSGYSRRVTLVIGSAVLLSVLTVVAPATGQGRRHGDVIRRSDRPVLGRYLVAVRTNDDPDAVAGAVHGHARGRVRHVYRHAFRGFAVETSEATARALAADPGVAYVEEDGVVQTSGVQSLDDAGSWGLDRIDQRVTWKDGALAYDHVYRYGASGSGVNVYIIDTGIRTTHIEFGGRAFNAIDIRSWESVQGDCNGHGTHVAGIVGGTRVGVAKFVTVHSVRVMGCDGYGYLSDLLAGIDWVTAYHLKPAVINMSIEAGESQTIDDAIQGAIAAGITYVGAAGNGAADGCLGLMANAPDALVIGASDNVDSRAYYSNHGPCVDLFAPGDGVLSSWGSSDAELAVLSGTSQAAPHVAGAAALYLEREPNASPQKVAFAILSTATTGVIQDAGLGSPNRLLFTGMLGDTTPPTVSVMEPVLGATIRGTQAVRVSVEDDVEVAKVVFIACGAQIGTASVRPYSIAWDSTASPDGACTVVVEAYDLAGHTGTARVAVVVANSRDEMPPNITLQADRSVIWPTNGQLVSVVFTGLVVDNGPDISTVSFVVRDEYGRVQPAGIAPVTNGRFRTAVQLEARRLGHDMDGRRYVMVVTGIDVAGNSATAAAQVLVPHDRR